MRTMSAHSMYSTAPQLSHGQPVPSNGDDCDMISSLIDKGYAYAGGNGDVYYCRG